MNLATDLYPKYDCIVVGGGIAGIMIKKIPSNNGQFILIPTLNLPDRISCYI